MKRDFLFLRGFTLVELLVVLSILAILVTLALPRYQGFLERGRQAEGIVFLSDVHGSQLRYRYENETGDWPPNDPAALDIGIPELRYFDNSTLTLNTDGSAVISRKPEGGWSYTLRVYENGSFSYESGGQGPGGLPK